jgi:16S rRNA (cytidine1402-2'-O)-methyltransferase
MLYIVSTPIGNLRDITLRAIDTLKEVDLILAEDTRRTIILLKEYSIPQKKILSYNDFNCHQRTSYAVSLMKTGAKVALVSDAGTPGISDPGFFIVREAVKEGIQVIPIPGACAAVAAVSCSGLPSDRFGFFGFLPKKEKKLVEILVNIKNMQGFTYVFYESPHRIVKTLSVMKEIIPERNIVLARELTKKFEEFIRGTVSEVYEKVSKSAPRGEIVIVVN